MTLIELMVAMVIIGILSTLLLPVVGSVRASARRAEIVSEIQMLEDALTRFRNRYGVYPPSRIHLRQDGRDYASGPIPTRTA